MRHLDLERVSTEMKILRSPPPEIDYSSFNIETTRERQNTPMNNVFIVDLVSCLVEPFESKICLSVHEELHNPIEASAPCVDGVLNSSIQIVFTGHAR